MMSLLALMYFKTYRGIATGLRYIGGSLSGIAFPQAALYLQKEYGYRGSLLIFGAISLHIVLVCYLLKEKSQGSKETQYTALPLARTQGFADVSFVPETSNSKNEPVSLGRKAYVWYVLKLFRSPFFYVLLISFVAIDYTNTTYVSTVVDFGLDQGFPIDKAESVISYTSLGEIIGFILPPLISDRKYISRSALYSLTFFLFGIAMLLQGETHSYATFVVVSVTIKFCIGCATTMRTVLVGDYFGVDRLTAFWSIVGVVTVPVFLLNPAVIGTSATFCKEYLHCMALIV